MAPTKLARALGWFSLGLGATELFAPHALRRTMALPEGSVVLRGFGLREIVTGVGLLTQRRVRPWLWGRVAGDVLDLFTLAAADRGRSTGRQARAGAGAFVLSALALDLFAATRR